MADTTNKQIDLNKSILTDEQMCNMLVGAFEGGSNYWYFLKDLSMIPKVGYKPQTEYNIKSLGEHKEFDSTQKHRMIDCLVHRIFEAAMLDIKVPVFDSEADEDDNEPLGYLTKESMIKGSYLMLQESPEHFANIISENDDAETADVFLQYAVLGEIVYG